MVDMDKVMAAMNGPGDTPKISPVLVRAMKKAALAEALKAKKAKMAKKPTGKVIPIGKAKKAAASRKTSKKVSKAPLKKAASSKKVVRKTMRAKRGKRGK